MRSKNTASYGLTFWRTLGASILSLFLVSACATAPDPTDPEAVQEYQEINDPAEPTNRAVFSVNRAVDMVVLKPAAGMYRHLVPPAVRDGIHNALNNLRSPVVLFNDLLQGEFERAGSTVMRFVLNSTIGVLGLGDPATSLGFEYHHEDFGQTLAVWGIGEGPYVMLPILGPSNPRDAIGLAVDFVVDPFSRWADNTDRAYITYTRSGVRGVDGRARNYDALEELERSSLDYYATVRSLYRQRRADDVYNGEGRAIMPTPGLSRVPAGPRLDKPEEISLSK